MSERGFNSVVAARTRAAREILESPDLLDKYREVGGLPRDLEGIVQAGEMAEAANLGQSQTKSKGKVATARVLAQFLALKNEYSVVMGVVSRVRAELAESGDSPELVTRLDSIIVNEAQVSVTVTADETGAKKRKVSRSVSQEALRAEIAKDAAALLELVRRFDPEQWTWGIQNRYTCRPTSIS